MKLNHYIVNLFIYINIKKEILSYNHEKHKQTQQELLLKIHDMNKLIDTEKLSWSNNLDKYYSCVTIIRRAKIKLGIE